MDEEERWFCKYIFECVDDIECWYCYHYDYYPPCMDIDLLDYCYYKD